MKLKNRKKYFNDGWKDVDIALVPLKFTVTSAKIRESFIKLIRHNDSIADLGCGMNGNAKIFQSINPKIIYTGVDFSKIAINKAKKLNHNINTHYIVQDVEKGSFLKNKFSLVFCSQLIEHVKDDNKFISNIFESLKPKGDLLISTVYRKNGAKYIYKNMYGESVLAPDHINEYTDVNSLLDKLRKQGFEIIDYDLTLFRYPIIDVGLKYIMKYFNNQLTFKIINSSLMMAIRYYLVVPIFGFYNFQVIAKKKA